MVNSVTEVYLVHIINTYRSMNIPMSDQRHPIVQLETWPEKECVRGVAGGKTVPLVGGVVMRLTMPEKGTNKGPNILVRFKITGKGTTDWVGMILGARAIDHVSLGGLGHQSCPNGHWMAASNIMMDVFGKEVGYHARSAIGTNTLPLDIAAEVEAFVLIKP